MPLYLLDQIMGISVVINTYNAEKHLERVLAAAKGFDEIVICDMHSTDRTLDIAEKQGCKVIFHERTGIVEPARNAAIQAASHEWVLVIDADEIIPHALRDYLYGQIQLADPPHGIRIPMKNYFMGQFMHAAYPSYLLRFFRKDSVYWAPFIHAQPKVDGRIFTIPSSKKEVAFIHLSNDSVATYIAKTNVYSEKEIEKRKGKKYNSFLIFTQTSFRFFKQYILKGGIRDGVPGLCYAFLYAFYKFSTMAKVYESQLKDDSYDPELRS